MLSFEESKTVLRNFFNKKYIADIGQLYHLLQTTSRMSVFRRLKRMGYLTSFTDAGRYYTLQDVPIFDEWGLWFHKGIGFSQYGTLKNTIIKIVHSSDAGMMPKEMLNLLKIRIPNTLHNALHGLVKNNQIGRRRLERFFLYTDANPEKAQLQLNTRRFLLQKTAPVVEPPSAELTIAVLIEAFKTVKIRVSPTLVAERLDVRGMSVTVEQVKQIFTRHGIPTEKKTASLP
ncbi:hypothetical protein [Desulfosarcina ovata]|uniref:Uncharacterized protein n=1 Tax=Desulfosarcina ovata subsp. ovata TaxID=2752305 RepID=A0A5K8AKH2_9BACT|nr:hypothetical protein [Desulfosarcina ovata]BBO91523.1 hypothetical protein DSCOOX_47030 [Desulfosarcina ovata subsp. ovata]BBO92809.1 hypothetical protein DSCOOX_59890 [Desulfosarcina ovata subsp. ovata]BBO93191.1 hypothetical protein DSCOOX_63710 [Desulfosarcina ovata subsp. ovata]